MRIAPLAGPAAVAPAAPARPASSGFALAPDAAPPARLAAPSGLATVAPLMLVLQEQMTGEKEEREARRHGQAVLALLSDLQGALLAGTSAGGADGAQLASRLAALLEQPADTTHPGLATALRAIRLRARLELSKLGHR